jgi:hypothetical protein
MPLPDPEADYRPLPRAQYNDLLEFLHDHHTAFFAELTHMGAKLLREGKDVRHEIPILINLLDEDRRRFLAGEPTKHVWYR